MRIILKVENDNPISNRKFRNHFEHYDERIEDWFYNNSSAVYTDLAMNPFLQGKMGTLNNRGYNSLNNTLVFRGEVLDFGEILNALDEIRNNCKPYVLT